VARKRSKKPARRRVDAPEEDEIVRQYRVLVHLRRGDSSEDIGRAVGVPRQKVLAYVRQALKSGMLKLGRLPSALADDLKQRLGPAGRAVEIDIVPASSDTQEFYQCCAEQLVRIIRSELRKRKTCAIAIGGGRSTYRTVRNMPDPPPMKPEEGRQIRAFPATSGLDPNRPLLSALVVGALFRAALAAEAEGEETPYQAIVGDPYRIDNTSDLRQSIKAGIDLLVSGIGHKQYSYCAGVSGLAAAPDAEVAGEFLFQPFARNGLPVQPRGFHVDCAEEGAATAVDAAKADRLHTCYSLFSLRELAAAARTSERRPIVVGIATDYRRDAHGPGLRGVGQQAAGPEGPGTQEVSKVDAVLGALRGGFVQRLIVPMDLAERLLQRALEEDISGR